jgi:TonB family protein
MKCARALSVLLIYLNIGMLAAQTPGNPSASSHSVIPSDRAEQNLVTFVQPDYPPLAKATSVVGKVRVEIVIDETGSVKTLKLISGHPMLAPSAIQAIKKWKYRPFEVDGKPTAVETAVEVSMPQNISDDEVAHERKFQDTFWPSQRAGEEAYRKHDLRGAEAKLLIARAAAEERGDQKWLELSGVLTLLGNVKFEAGDFTAAEQFYKESLEIHEKHQRPDEAEVAGAQQSLAFLYFRTNQPTKAEPLYAQSVATYEKRILDMEWPDAQASYGRHLALGFFALSQIALADGRTQDAQGSCRKAISYAEKWSDDGDKRVIKLRCESLVASH